MDTDSLHRHPPPPLIHRLTLPSSTSGVQAWLVAMCWSSHPSTRTKSQEVHIAVKCLSQIHSARCSGLSDPSLGRQRESKEEHDEPTSGQGGPWGIEDHASGSPGIYSHSLCSPYHSTAAVGFRASRPHGAAPSLHPHRWRDRQRSPHAHVQGGPGQVLQEAASKSVTPLSFHTSFKSITTESRKG